MVAATIELPRAYRALLWITVLESALVFARPLGVRATTSSWQLSPADTPLQHLTIDLHAIAALLWVALCMLQFALGARAHSPRARRAHGVLGRVLVFVVVPLMSGLSLAALRLNPLQQPGFVVANAIGMFGAATLAFVLGLVALRDRDLRAHVDAMYIAFVLLSGVVSHRVVVLLAFHTSGTMWTTWPALIAWVVLGLKLLVPLGVHRRLRANSVLLGVLLGALLGFGAWGVARGLFEHRPPPRLHTHAQQFADTSGARP